MARSIDNPSREKPTAALYGVGGFPGWVVAITLTKHTKREPFGSRMRMFYLGTVVYADTVPCLVYGIVSTGTCSC